MPDFYQTVKKRKLLWGQRMVKEFYETAQEKHKALACQELLDLLSTLYFRVSIMSVYC